MRPDTARAATGAVVLELPLGREWDSVARLVLGAVASLVDMGFQEIDDLQLGVERLLAEAGAQESVRLVLDTSGDGPEGSAIRVRVGPLRESAIAEGLQAPDPPPGQLTLRRILETLVDSFGVEEAAGGQIVVRLEKLARRA